MAINTDAPAEVKTHTAEDVRNLSRKRMGVYRNRQRVLNTAQIGYWFYILRYLLDGWLYAH